MLKRFYFIGFFLALSFLVFIGVSQAANLGDAFKVDSSAGVCVGNPLNCAFTRSLASLSSLSD